MCCVDVDNISDVFFSLPLIAISFRWWWLSSSNKTSNRDSGIFSEVNFMFCFIQLFVMFHSTFCYVSFNFMFCFFQLYVLFLSTFCFVSFNFLFCFFGGANLKRIFHSLPFQTNISTSKNGVQYWGFGNTSTFEGTYFQTKKKFLRFIIEIRINALYLKMVWLVKLITVLRANRSIIKQPSVQASNKRLFFNGFS